MKKLNKIRIVCLITVLLCFGQQVFTQTDWSVLGTKAFSPGKAYAQVILKKSPAGVLYVAFQDSTQSGYCSIQVWKYTGTQWVSIGSVPLGSSCGNIAFTIDHNETPWLFYSEPGNGHGTVRKFTGGSFALVGNQYFTSSSVYWPCIAVTTSGTPIVAYADYNNQLRATVMQYNGTNWVMLGNTVASTAISSWLSLVLDQNNTPYLAVDEGYIRIKTLAGGNWVSAGGQIFQNSNAGYCSLAVSPNNKIYLCYADQTGNSYPQVYRLDNNNWTRIGDYFDGANMCYYPSIAIDNNEIPYIAVQDNNLNDHKASVFTYNGANWVPAGDTGISDGFIGINYDFAYSSLSIVIDNSGAPVIAYADNMNGRKVTSMRYPGCAACVWPGDADNNNIVNNFDILPISVGYGLSGTPRVGASIQWIGQKSANWQQVFQNSVNYKYADTNGDGSINNNDLQAITQNWNHVHNLKKTENALSRNAQQLSVNLLNDTISPSDTLRFEVIAGETNAPLDSAYAFAFDITFNPQIVDLSTLSVNFENNWLGAEPTLLSIAYINSATATVHIGIAKTDHQPQNGTGKIASIYAVANTILPQTNYYTDIAVITNNQMVTPAGSPVQLTTIADTTFVQQNISNSIPQKATPDICIYPNPATSDIHIKSTEPIGEVQITDMRNVNYYSYSEIPASVINLPIPDVPQGIYIIRVTDIHKNTTCYKLIKQ